MASTQSPQDTLLDAVRRFASEPRPMLVDGEWREAADGASFPTVDPATGEAITDVAEAGPADVDRAVAAARRALTGPWARLSPADRARLISRLGDAVEACAEELAQLESLDNGKLVANARNGDLVLAADHFRYFAGWATKLTGESIPTAYREVAVTTQRVPVGVVAAIIPWNFPLSTATWKLAPALAAGCTVVLKPAEETPLTALWLGRLATEVGFPPGVVNVLPGFGERTGEALVRHPGVDKIAFTGSTEVGRHIAATAARTGKQVSLELGGKSPNIVLADADRAAAAEGAAAAIFYETGQVCSAGSRLMVQAAAYDEVVQRVVEAGRRLRPGPGLDPGSSLGPLVSQTQLDRVGGYVERGRAEGAELLLGGARPGGELAGGYFFEPTVLGRTPDETTVVREEIFGPVLVVQRFEDDDELVRRVNDGQYGLAAGIWSSDLAAAQRLASRLHAGTVWINCYGLFDAAVPFGGVKASGYGRDGGPEAIEKFLGSRAVWSNLAPLGTA